MDFSLSSSLVGSAVSNPDKLALDLQFATDKTLTARKGPTPAFTRGSSGTFVGSNGLIQSVGNNVARFDHDPLTLDCKGLLIEESRTNNSWYSGVIVNGTGWSTNESTSVVDGVGPDGNNAYTITETTLNSVHTVGNTGGSAGTGATSTVSGTIYTGSIFVKKVAGSIDWVQLTLGSAGFGAAQFANFNLSNGAIGNSLGATPRIENYGNGWYRCSISVTATATSSAALNVILAFINNTNTTSRVPSYFGSTNNKVLSAMCQFETGSFPTSYIPTTTASVIRSADVCSISGSAFSGFYNPLEGSLATSQIFNTPISNAAGQFIIDINDTTATNRLRYFRNPTTGFSGFANTSNSTVNVALGGAPAIQPFVIQKYSAGFKLDDYAFYVNNSQLGIDNLGALLISPTTMTIGDASAGAARQYLNGTIYSLRYYKKRLPNEKLQALTA